MQAVLISNGPGELTTWLKPVLEQLRQVAPHVRISIVLVPCQFASGNEADVARSYGADAVISVRDYLRFAATGRVPSALVEDTEQQAGGQGFVLSLGGDLGMALRLAKALHYPCYRYSFVPWWHVRLKRLFVSSSQTYHQARRLGAPKAKLEPVGNLVADVLEDVQLASMAGSPRLMLMFGSRDNFAIYIIPLFLALVDALQQHYPHMTFVAPRSRLLSDAALQAGVSNQHGKDVFPDSVAGVLKGNTIRTPRGATIQLIDEAERHAYMKAVAMALTIPGTNTLELGMAGVSALVVLPLNKPEVIPLEGIGHWLGMIPFVGTWLKRRAVLLAAPHFPVSLPNHFSGHDLMLEYKGDITLQGMLTRARHLLDDPSALAQRRQGLLEHMPKAGAAEKLVASILADFS